MCCTVFLTQGSAMTDQSPDTIAALKDKEPSRPPRSQWIDVWEQLKHHKGALFGGGFLIFITLAVIFMPYIWQMMHKT